MSAARANKSVEERITDIEDELAGLDQKFVEVNESINNVGDSLEGILELSDIINQINSRVSALENGQITLILTSMILRIHWLSLNQISQ